MKSLAYHGAALIERYNVKDVEPIVVENDVMTVTFNPVGGKISSVVIKEHNRYGKDENVDLINPGSAYFGIDLHRHGANHEAINTNDYLFDCTPVVNEDGIVEKVIMTLLLIMRVAWLSIHTRSTAQATPARTTLLTSTSM